MDLAWNLQYILATAGIHSTCRTKNKEVEGMQYLRTIVATAIAGIFVMSVWGAFVVKYGIGGGWFAGFAIISVMWFMNHHIGFIENPSGAAFVDMAMAIGIAGTTRDMFMAGSITPGVDAIPTLMLVVLGGITGGIFSAMFNADLTQKAEKEAKIKASL